MENELAAIDLSKENVKLDQRRLRFRHMEIQRAASCRCIRTPIVRR
jgi:hypothetical protein